MKRRRFLQGMALAGLAPNLAWAQRDELAVDALLPLWMQENDRSVTAHLEKQNRDRSSPFCGGFPNQQRLYFVGSTAQIAKRMVVAYISKQSDYYESDRLVDALDLAAKFLLDMQHEDGTIDLISTNFHSTPDTGFAVEPIATGLQLIRTLQPHRLPDYQEAAERFLRKAGEALAVGGIHTPNHRWVVCRGLARIHSLMPASKYVRRIDRWLREGVDIDPDGQYTEQSVAGYTPLVNRCFITIARLLNRYELFEPVRKNLAMSKYYLHANGELVTEASNRQDQYQVALPTKYYYAYRYMAIKDNDSEFAGMARTIESTVGASSLGGELVAFLEDPEIRQPLPAPTPPPDEYTKVFQHSGLIRIRRKAIDATILAGNDRFFTFFKGQAALQAVRIASAFFGKGQFVGTKVITADESVVLTQELTGPYYQPFPADSIPGDGDWEKLSREMRPQSEVMTLKTKVSITEQSGTFRLRIEVTDTDHVPVAIELAFRKGGELRGVKELEPSCFLLGKGRGRYRMGTDEIAFGPGGAEHEWTQLRGALPKLDAMSVYITGYTPFECELQIS